MLWLEKIIGVDLGIWGWVLDFLLIGLVAAWWLVSDKDIRARVAWIVGGGMVAFGALWLLFA